MAYSRGKFVHPLELIVFTLVYVVGTQGSRVYSLEGVRQPSDEPKWALGRSEYPLGRPRYPLVYFSSPEEECAYSEDEDTLSGVYVINPEGEGMSRPDFSLYPLVFW